MFQSLFVNEMTVVAFCLVLIRMSSFLVSSNIFNSTQMSPHIKVLMSIILSLVFFESHKTWKINIDGLIVIFAAKEVLIGVVLGFVTRFFFLALTMASELMSHSLGLSSASVFNPLSGLHSTLLAQFQGVLSILVFFAIEGHHVMISAIFQSFDLIMIDQLNVSFQGLGEFVSWSQKLFEIALKVSAPIVCAIFLVNLGMGILGRAVPQINVFVTSFQVTIAIGFLVLFISMPIYLTEIVKVFDVTHTQLFKVMRSF